MPDLVRQVAERVSDASCDRLCHRTRTVRINDEQLHSHTALGCGCSVPRVFCAAFCSRYIRRFFSLPLAYLIGQSIAPFGTRVSAMAGTGRNLSRHVIR